MYYRETGKLAAVIKLKESLTHFTYAVLKYSYICWFSYVYLFLIAWK